MMNLTDDQRMAADNLLAAQQRRELHFEGVPRNRIEVIDKVLATRKAELFNARYAVGAVVMYIPGIEKEPQRERVYRAARVEKGRAVVELAGVLIPVDVDQCFSGIEKNAPSPSLLSVRLIAIALITGFALALIVTTARAVSPERIVIDCHEPGEEPGAVDEQATWRRT